MFHVKHFGTIDGLRKRTFGARGMMQSRDLEQAKECDRVYSVKLLLNFCMTHYAGIVEEEDGKAVGVWFPDLPGCVLAGDTLDDAILNAAEALELWAGAMIESGQKIPPPRSLTGLKTDPEVAQDLANFMVALIPFPENLRQRAAE